MKELRTCICGRLHFVDTDIINEALHLDKNVLLICGRCGRATMIGADREPDYWGGSDEEVFNMYSYNAGDGDCLIDAWHFENHSDFKGIHKLIYSVGKGVPMETGDYANTYIYGRFEDNWHPDFYHIKHDNVTVEEILKFISQWEKDKKTVNMARLLREYTDEELKLISGFHFEGMDWSGTKYDVAKR